MPERPLLLFPTPDVASRSKLKPPISNVHKPSADHQWDKLSPKFQQLQDAFTEQRVKIQQGVTGIEPEQVLVIETVGSIDKFVTAVRKIQGLEWLAEIEGEGVAPDEYFYDEKKLRRS